MRDYSRSNISSTFPHPAGNGSSPGCSQVHGPPIAQHPMPRALTSISLLPNLRVSILQTSMHCLWLNYNRPSCPGLVCVPLECCRSNPPQSTRRSQRKERIQRNICLLRVLCVKKPHFSSTLSREITWDWSLANTVSVCH